MSVANTDLEGRADHWATAVDNGAPTTWDRFRRGLLAATKVNNTDRLMEWVLDVAEQHLDAARRRRFNEIETSQQEWNRIPRREYCQDGDGERRQAGEDEP